MAARPLRILQIMRAPVGGLFRHVSDLTQALAERGHDIGLIVDSQSSDAQTQMRLDGLSPSVSLGIHQLPMPRILGVHDAITPFNIRRLAKTLDVSILHGHGAKGGFGARFARMGSSNLRAVYTPHGGALHFDPRTPLGASFMAIERGLVRLSDALIFESDYAHRAFATQVALPPDGRAHMIHNGLGAGEFEPVLPHSDAADFVFIGELRTLKGIDLIIEALSGLFRPDGRPATLIMAGDGPDRAALERSISAHGLSDRVSLAGVQPARSMLARGRTVLVPSRAESLPYVVLEAAAAARPIIATRVGGIAEIFGPTSDNLIPAGDVPALRGAMAQALNAPDDMQAEAVRRREHVRATFSLSAMVEGIEAVYGALE